MCCIHWMSWSVKKTVFPEQILAPHERPAAVIKLQQEQAGYDYEEDVHFPTKLSSAPQGRISEYVGFAVWFFFPKFLTTCSARVGSIWELRVSRPFTVRVYPPSPLFSYQHADSIAPPYLPRNPISKFPSISSSPVPPLANSASKTYPLKQTPPRAFNILQSSGWVSRSNPRPHDTVFAKQPIGKASLAFPPPQNSQPFETQISSRANVYGEPLQPRHLVQQDYRTSAYREDKNTWRFIITGNLTNSPS